MLPIIIASENGEKGARVAVQILRDGGSALDAVEQACRVVEDDPDEVSVGYGGLPNALGEVELDASIMDGRSLRVGAVAALRGYGNAITLARAVMEQTPHVLLAGAGAAQLAKELGYPRANQRTDSTLARWRERFARHGLPPGERDGLLDAVRRLTQPLDLQAENVRKSTGAAAEKAADGDLDVFGTVNFLARDRDGHLASAVSTSGLGWKYPRSRGRFVDSRRGQLLRQPPRRGGLHGHGRMVAAAGHGAHAGDAPRARPIAGGGGRRHAVRVEHPGCAAAQPVPRCGDADAGRRARGLFHGRGQAISLSDGRDGDAGVGESAGGGGLVKANRAQADRFRTRIGVH